MLSPFARTIRWFLGLTLTLYAAVPAQAHAQSGGGSTTAVTASFCTSITASPPHMAVFYQGGAVVPVDGLNRTQPYCSLFLRTPPTAAVTVPSAAPQSVSARYRTRSRTTAGSAVTTHTVRYSFDDPFPLSFIECRSQGSAPTNADISSITHGFFAGAGTCAGGTSTATAPTSATGVGGGIAAFSSTAPSSGDTARRERRRSAAGAHYNNGEGRSSHGGGAHIKQDAGHGGAGSGSEE